MRVTFMGTPDFAVPSLQALISSRHEIVSVFTAPPRRANRGKKIVSSPVHQLADAHAIAVRTPESLRDPIALATLQADAPDIVIVVAYGMLLPQAVLDLAPYGCVNVHPSALPRWRGAAPIQRTLMAGDATTSICIMRMDRGLDTGDILSETPYSVPQEINGSEFSDILSYASAPLLLDVIDGLEAGTISPQSQSEDGVTYAKKIDKLEAVLDFAHFDAAALYHHIRGLSPYPGGFIIYDDERVKWLTTSVIETGNQHPPGTVIDDQFTVQCRHNGLRPATLQRAGKQPVSLNDFLRGFTLEVGKNIQPPLPPRQTT